MQSYLDQEVIHFYVGAAYPYEGRSEEKNSSIPFFDQQFDALIYVKRTSRAKPTKLLRERFTVN